MEATITTPFTGTHTDTAVSELLALVARERASHVRRWCRQDISMTALHVLMVLEASGPLAMSRLADILEVAVSNATGIVSRMEERGLVRRTHDETDRRVVFVTATDTGRRVLEDREFMRAEQLRQVLAAMTDQGRADFVRAIRDFLTTAEKLRAEGRLVEDESDQVSPRLAAPVVPLRA